MARLGSPQSLYDAAVLAFEASRKVGTPCDEWSSVKGDTVVLRDAMNRVLGCYRAIPGKAPGELEMVWASVTRVQAKPSARSVAR